MNDLSQLELYLIEEPNFNSGLKSFSLVNLWKAVLQKNETIYEFYWTRSRNITGTTLSTILCKKNSKDGNNYWNLPIDKARALWNELDLFGFEEI